VAHGCHCHSGHHGDCKHYALLLVAFAKIIKCLSFILKQLAGCGTCSNLAYSQNHNNCGLYVSQSEIQNPYIVLLLCLFKGTQRSLGWLVVLVACCFSLCPLMQRPHKFQEVKNKQGKPPQAAQLCKRLSLTCFALHACPFSMISLLRQAPQ
jgi:hypothetical protein